MPFIPMRDGKPLYVRVIGKGQPVLMLPGLGMSSRQWLPFILPHIRSHRFYMPDFRGHGRSLHVRLNQTDVFQNNTDDVRDIIEYFQLNDFLLAGISLGATTAMHLQRETEFEGVRHYLHIDQSPNVLNSNDWAHGLAGQQQPELFELMRQTTSVFSQHDGHDHFYQLPRSAKKTVAKHAANIASIFEMSSTAQQLLLKGLPLLPTLLGQRLPFMHLEDMSAYLRAYSNGGHDYRPSLGSGDTPVTLMIGMKSPLYSCDGQEWVANTAEKSRIVRFEKSGHVPFLDEPRKFTREFKHFLYQLPA